MEAMINVVTYRIDRRVAGVIKARRVAGVLL
jgi:hypothetical protein